jgi:hypothetical protein
VISSDSLRHGIAVGSLLVGVAFGLEYAAAAWQGTAPDFEAFRNPLVWVMGGGAIVYALLRGPHGDRK